MSSATRKNKRSATRSRGRVFWFLKWGAIAGLVCGAFGAATVAIMFWIYGADPNLRDIASLSDYDPPEVTRVLTQDGDVIGEIYTERRTYVPYEKLPPHLIHAFVDAEDADFFQHKGIDYMGMFRALIVNIKAGGHRQGGSTITQQVVKNFLLTREKTLKRKFQEIILARRLENRLTKEEIITLYANEIFFGEGRYGVQEASRYYFGKNVWEINVGEAAVLAGLPKAPSHYSPKREQNRQAAKTRQTYVLRQMVKRGHLSKEEAEKWINAPIEVVRTAFPKLGSAPEWVSMVRGELERRYSQEEVPNLGVNATTTMDLKTQQVATAALRKGLREYDARKGYGRPIRSVKPKRVPQEVKRLAKRLPKKGPRTGGEYQAVVVKVADSEVLVDLGNWRASIVTTTKKSRFNPSGKKATDRFKVGDVVRVSPLDRPPAKDAKAPTLSERQVQLAKGPEGAVVVLDPNTRHLLAIVGGYDSRVGGFNRATMAKRQAGSTFKPFVYAAAVDSGDFTAASIVNDAPEVYDLWKPQNYKKGEFEGPVRLRYALAKSINTVAIRVANDLGPENIAVVAKSLGIESDLPQTLSLALGSGEVTPLELTNAFASFAAGGKSAPPQVIKTLESDDQKDVPPPPAFRQALRPEVAYVSLDMMRSVVTEGTGGRARALKMDIAGKTGTSNDARDAWFIGLSPEVAVGVWVGFDDFGRPLGSKEGGSRTALPIFVDIMKQIGTHGSRFARPEGVAVARIDARTGLLAPPNAGEGAYEEVFIEGTVPVETAPAPGELDVADYVLDQYDDPYAEGTGAPNTPAPPPTPVPSPPSEVQESP